MNLELWLRFVWVADLCVVGVALLVLAKATRASSWGSFAGIVRSLLIVNAISLFCISGSILVMTLVLRT